MNIKLHQQMFEAVSQGDYKQVKDLLSDGVNVNFVSKDFYNKNTFLHYAPTVEIVKELLLHGAQIDAKDYNGKTPLYYAVSQRKDLAIIIELLEHGADPNARSVQGTTALTPAITNRNLDVVKVLLDYGADVNVKTISPLLRYPTPLAIAVTAHEECAKLMIKHSLLENFDNDYKKIIDLDVFTESINYNKLSNFLENCICEIVQMKTEKANDNLSLYNFVREKNINIKLLYDRFKEKNEEQLSTDYPIYHDFIFHKVDLYLQRVFLLDKLNSLQIFSYRNNGSTSEIILNSDCLYKIAEYLSNKELFKFIASFDKNIDLSSVSHR